MRCDTGRGWCLCGEFHDGKTSLRKPDPAPPAAELRKVTIQKLPRRPRTKKPAPEQSQPPGPEAPGGIPFVCPFPRL
jgi:hypothetical protein